MELTDGGITREFKGKTETVRGWIEEDRKILSPVFARSL